MRRVFLFTAVCLAFTASARFLPFPGTVAKRNFSAGTPPVLQSITVSGPSTLYENGSYAFTATAGYDYGPDAIVTLSSVWSETGSLPNVSINSGTGYVTVGNRDTTNNYTVRADYGGEFDTLIVSIQGSPEAEPPAGQLYPYIAQVEPTNGYPAAFAAFNPPVSTNTPALSTPQIAEWTREAGPGDTIALTGESLGNDFVFFGTASTNVATAIFHDGQEAAVTLPSGLPSDELYLMWPTNSFGYGTGVVVNKTEAWWVGPDEAAVGDTFAVYGRNLGAGTQLWIDGHGWVTNQTANPYRAEFIVPAGLTPGSYQAYAHSGVGRKYGWSDALMLEVVTATDWAAGTTNIVGGFTLSAINTAIGLCTNNDTVYFPNGTYQLSGSMVCTKDNIRFLGQSTTGVVITAASGFPGGAELVDMSGRDNVHFDTLTFDTGTHVTDLTPWFRFNTVTDCSFTGVKFTSENHASTAWDSGNGFEFHSSRLLKFVNCEFNTSSLLNFKRTDQLFIENCNFFMRNECWIVINHGRGKEASITGCTFDNHDFSDYPTGTGLGRVYQAACKNGSDIGRNENIYFADNETIDLALDDDKPPRIASSSGQGEHYLVDKSPVQFRGTGAVGQSANTVEFASIPSVYEYAKSTLVIVGGTGLGQIRDITGYDTGTDIITVSPDWNVIPDATSIINVGAYPRRNVVYNNIFDAWDTTSGDTPNVNSIGVYFYGGCVDNIIVNNTFTDFRDAICLHSMTGSDTSTRPMFFNMVASNSVADTWQGIKIQNGESGDTVPTYFDYSMLGNVYRDLVISNSDKTQINLRERVSTSYTMDMQIFENVAMTSPAGYKGFVHYEGNSLDSSQTGVTESQVWLNCTTNGGAYAGETAH